MLKLKFLYIFKELFFLRVLRGRMMVCHHLPLKQGKVYSFLDLSRAMEPPEKFSLKIFLHPALAQISPTFCGAYIPPHKICALHKTTKKGAYIPPPFFCFTPTFFLFSFLFIKYKFYKNYKFNQKFINHIIYI